MRLIDLDDVQYTEVESNDIYPVNIKYISKEALERMPIIEAVPVRHGKWERIEPDDHYDFRCECSNCKSYRIMTTDEKDEYNYCPACGCKMDLDEVEE